MHALCCNCYIFFLIKVYILYIVVYGCSNKEKSLIIFWGKYEKLKISCNVATYCDYQIVTCCNLLKCCNLKPKNYEPKKLWREKYPLKTAYQTLKYNSKRRGKVFELTFSDFEAFVIKTKYLKGRGIYKDSYHIDRVDESKGYTIDNIQVLKNCDNVRKYIDYKGRDEKNRPILKTEMAGVNEFEDCPF